MIHPDIKDVSRFKGLQALAAACYEMEPPLSLYARVQEIQTICGNGIRITPISQHGTICWKQ